MKNLKFVSIIFILILFVSQNVIAKDDDKITFIALGHVYPDYEAEEGEGFSFGPLSARRISHHQWRPTDPLQSRYGQTRA